MKDGNRIVIPVGEKTLMDPKDIWLDPSLCLQIYQLIQSVFAIHNQFFFIYFLFVNHHKNKSFFF